jgi:hypothetical protein
VQWNRGVWGNPVKIVPDMIVIGLMWVYVTKKSQPGGLFLRVRSRITLLGNQERDILPRIEAYAPVSQVITTRLFIAMHLHILGILFRKIDVKNAYINENMRRIVFTKCPPGYTFHFHTDGGWSFRRLKPGEKAPPDMALPLHKALYGGMECGRIFWEAWVGWHLSNGFQIIHEERCYLSKRDDKGNFIKLGFHVDDNVVIALGLGYYQEF